MVTCHVVYRKKAFLFHTLSALFIYVMEQTCNGFLKMFMVKRSTDATDMVNRGFVIRL